MSAQTSSIDDAISAVDRLRKTLSKNNSAQVRTSTERSAAKATAHTWFKSVRPNFQLTSSDQSLLQNVDDGFRQLLGFSDYLTSRSRYKSCLKTLRDDLIHLRSELVLQTPAVPPKTSGHDLDK